MPDADPAALRDLLAASGDPAGRFAADEAGRFALSELTETSGLDAADLAGRCVMLACGRQMQAAHALIQLDGAARRIVLCPPDLAREHWPHVLAQAGVDAVVSDDPAAGGDVPTVRIGPPGSGGPPARRWNGETEWIMFTSGTTGRPKMVVHTLRTLAGHLPSGPPRGGPATWCTFYDVRRYGGLQILLRALIGGGSLVLSAADEAPGAFMARAARDGARRFLGTPSHWRRALMTEQSGLIAPDYVRLSGEVADQAVLDRLRALFPDAALVHAFAATETGVAFEVDDGLAGFPARLLDEGGPVTLRVQGGSLRVRSSRTALRRLEDGAPSLADPDGFVDTGDIVARDGDRCRFEGRREGIVNVGGQKVHPEEVEDVINRHPGVRMSLVRARPSPITGAVVVADIVAQAAGDPALERALSREIIDLCRSGLAAHKVPAMIRFVPALELAPSGKLVRRHA